MTWKFFIFVAVAMETSKKLFFLDTGQKQFLQKVVNLFQRQWYFPWVEIEIFFLILLYIGRMQYQDPFF